MKQYIESEVLELKRSFTPDISKEIIALANTKGGKIIIGISDDGILVGVENSKQIIESLSSLINDSIKPDITAMISINVDIENNKELVIIEVLRGNNQPYYLASKGLKPLGVYIRLGNTSIPANENAIRQMILQTDGTRYEIMRSFNQELHFDFASRFFNKHGLAFESSNMRTLGMINIDGLFTNLALLCSDECQHIIKIAVFEDTTNSKFLDRKEFEGSVLKQLIEAFDYLKLNNKKRGRYEGIERIDSSDYDDLVLREALLNAIVHRDYGFSGSIIINIYADRIEFVSIGGLVSGISMDDIMIGVSQTRNDRLANIFYRLELLESYGTGIKKIVESYKHSPLSPEFKATSGAFLVKLPNRNYKAEISSVQEDEADYLFIDKTQSVLSLFENHKFLTRKEIQSQLDLKQTSSIVLLKKLETAGYIMKIGKGKNVKYMIK